MHSSTDRSSRNNSSKNHSLKKMVPLHLIALFTGLIPIVSVHLTYLISASQGFVPWCIPYVDSCVSISATGRYGAAFFLFKGTMIPAAMLLMAFWFLSFLWLRRLGDHGRYPTAIFYIGVIGAIFLIVYTVALGAAGETLRLQRRIGITIYFAFTFFSQLLMTYRLGVLKDTKIRIYLQMISYTVLAVGLCTVALGLLLDNYEQDYENAFEWVAALLIHLYFLVIWYAWRQDKLGFRLSLKDP